MGPKPDVVEWFDEEQRSEEWFLLRRGIPTSSNFPKVLAEGKDGGDSKGRERYMKRLAGEILTGQIAESFRNDYMQRGVRMEPMALDHYERANFCDLQRVGFVRRTVNSTMGESFVVGGSPDAWLPEQSRVIEVKTMAPDLLMDVVRFPAEHKAQCQGNMWIMGAQTCDLVMFYEGVKAPPRFRIERDEAYIEKLIRATEVFVWELKTLVQQKRKQGW